MTSSDTTKPNWLLALDMLGPAEPREIEFRLYYDDQGSPTVYSMEDLPGRYICVDAMTFAEGRYDLRIVDGQIHRAKKMRPGKIKPGKSGVSCHATNAMIIDPHSHIFWELQNYED